MREIRMLRAMWRGLETGLRTTLHGHERGNPGYGQGESYRSPRQSSTLPPWSSSPAVSRVGTVRSHFKGRFDAPVLLLRP